MNASFALALGEKIKNDFGEFTIRTIVDKISSEKVYIANCFLDSDDTRLER